MYKIINKFESTIADYFGSKYAVSTDCCTHALELCLRLLESANVACPKQTYVSVPMTLEKLNISWTFGDVHWEKYYYLKNTPIIDAAVLWEESSYIPNTFMCISFQHKKHLSLGRGGMILLDDIAAYNKLIKMVYDGRSRDKLWAQQSIDIIGYHYYMTPETAEIGLKKFLNVKNLPAKQWSYLDYPDLSKLPCFAKKLN